MNGAAKPSRPASSLRVAAGLALAAAVSLGLARFSYALLLPPMRADLGWSYFTAGAMNTVNAAGYLVGALLLPRALARFDARDVLLAGSGGAGVLLALHGLVTGEAALFALRLLTGVTSAAAFVAGGLLAARLAAAPGTASPAGAGTPLRHGAGLILGIYYGGTGAGIIASALLVPPIVLRTHGPRLAGRLDRARGRGAAGDRRHPHRDPPSRRRPHRRGGSPALRLAAVRLRAGRLPALRPRLHRLHDLRHQPAARAAPRQHGDRRLLRAARRGGDRIVVAVGRRPAALSRRRIAEPAERAARRRHAAPGAQRPPARGLTRPGCCSAASSCRSSHRPPRWCVTTCRRPRGPAASAPSRSSSLPARSSVRA